MNNITGNTWEIIKEQIVEGNPGTLKNHISINKAAAVFSSLFRAGNLRDENKASDSFNADWEVSEAFHSIPFIEELTKAGII